MQTEKRFLREVSFISNSVCLAPDTPAFPSPTPPPPRPPTPLKLKSAGVVGGFRFIFTSVEGVRGLGGWDGGNSLCVCVCERERERESVCVCLDSQKNIEAMTKLFPSTT